MLLIGKIKDLEPIDQKFFKHQVPMLTHVIRFEDWSINPQDPEPANLCVLKTMLDEVDALPRDKILMLEVHPVPAPRPLTHILGYAGCVAQMNALPVFVKETVLRHVVAKANQAADAQT